MAAASKPKEQWSRQEGNLIYVVTRLHRSLGIEVAEPLLFDAGFKNLVAQSKNGPAVRESRERAAALRGIAGQMRQHVQTAAEKLGLSDAWEKALGQQPVSARDRTRWSTASITPQIGLPRPSNSAGRGRPLRARRRVFNQMTPGDGLPLARPRARTDTAPALHRQAVALGGPLPNRV
jgi:hypothetical protein